MPTRPPTTPIANVQQTSVLVCAGLQDELIRVIRDDDITQIGWAEFVGVSYDELQRHACDPGSITPSVLHLLAWAWELPVQGDIDPTIPFGIGRSHIFEMGSNGAVQKHEWALYPQGHRKSGHDLRLHVVGNYDKPLGGVANLYRRLRTPSDYVDVRKKIKILSPCLDSFTTLKAVVGEGFLEKLAELEFKVTVNALRGEPLT